MAAKKKRIKRHKRLRSTCVFCRKAHSKSSHRFHGKGSYARTHKRKRSRRKK